MTINCIIVEDDILSAKILEKCLNRQSQFKLLKVFTNGEEAIEYISSNNVDCVFLDVELGSENGLNLINLMDKTPFIVVISSKKEYASEAFNFDVVDYIVKPITYDRFVKAINKVLTIKDIFKFENSNFFVKQSNKFVRINLSEICYIEALADYINIYFVDGKRLTILSTMKAFSANLPASTFVRIHRSFIVNIGKIVEFEDNSVSVGGKCLPVSRSNKDALFERIKSI